MTKKKPGRPRNTEFPRRYPLRHNARQMKAWLAAAARDGRNLQSWMRRALDECAKVG